MKILGIDPGTAIIGVGLIEYQNKKVLLKDYLCIKTDKKDSTAERLNDLFSQLTKIIKKYQPDLIAVEELFFFKNLKTAITVSHARGIILLAVKTSKIPVFEFTPLEIKQALTSYGRAEKQQVQKMVKILLKLAEIPKPDDMADALACAICHANSIK